MTVPCPCRANDAPLPLSCFQAPCHFALPITTTFRSNAPRHRDGLMNRLAAAGSAHRRAIEGPKMGMFPASFPAAFASLAAVGETVTAGTAVAAATGLPPLHVLRMRIFIVISSLAVLWMLGTILFKLLRAVWGFFMGKLPDEHMGSASGRNSRPSRTCLACCLSNTDSLTSGCQMRSDDSEIPVSRGQDRPDLISCLTISRSRGILSVLQ